MPSEPEGPYDARYSDGRTAASRPVRVAVESAGLAIIEGGAEIKRWRWHDVRLVETPAPDRPIRLANRIEPGSRLTVADPAALPTLRAHARYLTRDPLDKRRVLRVGGIAAACIAVVLFFLYGLPWVARPLVSLVPVAWEAPIGDSTITIVNKLFAKGRSFCGDTAGVRALEKLTGKLRATIETPYALRVDVADSDLINALAAPGGRILVFRGLIDNAGSPDEVAGVLAHEMAHLHHRHPTLGLINSVGWSALLSAFTGGASLSSEAVARLAGHLATSAYTRELETEADESAVAMLAAAGIGSDGLARFFTSVRDLEKKGVRVPEYLSTHPDTAERIAAIESRAARTTEPALSEAEWKALKAICRTAAD